MSDYCASKSLETPIENPGIPVTRESIGLRQFEVLLSKKQHVFYAGEAISGVVEIQLDAPITVMGLTLELIGEGQVSFTSRTTGFRCQSFIRETYVHEEMYLKDAFNDEEIKSDGFPFSLTLPEKLVCSFEGRYGRVRYSIKSTLKITKGSEISSDPLSFTIAPNLDLNQHSLAPLPISESHEKPFTGHPEPLTVSVFLPVRGFVLGQTVPLKIKLRNESTVDVTKLRIVLKKIDPSTAAAGYIDPRSRRKTIPREMIAM